MDYSWIITWFPSVQIMNSHECLTIMPVLFWFCLLFTCKLIMVLVSSKFFKKKNDSVESLEKDIKGATELILDKMEKLQNLVDDVKNNLICIHNELKGESEIIKLKILELEQKVMVLSGRQCSVAGSTLNGPPLPPPPPPPPPPMVSLNTPVLSLVKSAQSTQTGPKKKAPDGPPQLTFSQAEIASVLSKLKKTRNKSKLFSTDDNLQVKKTPPRRKLFSRNSSSSLKRSFTIVSPNT